jgi:hypothetical protein
MLLRSAIEIANLSEFIGREKELSGLEKVLEFF